MLEVRWCIEARKNYALRKSNDDAWIEEINNLPLQKEVFFVVPEGFLFTLHNKQRDEFEKRYNIAGVFELGSPYASTGVHMTLVQAVSSPVEVLNVGIFNGAVYDRRNNFAIKGTLETPVEYFEKFQLYIKEIENWINNGITPDSDPNGQYEFNAIPIEEVNPKRRDPSYYSRKVIEVRTLLEKEDTLRLGDVADILSSREDRKSHERVKRLKVSELKYPLDIYNVGYAKPTNIVVKHGDIIFPTIGDAKPFLFYGESEEPIYAPPNTAVIKCREILPEYLYLFLISDTAVHILNSITVGTTIRQVRMEDLVKLPIPKPTQEEQKYRVDFEILTSLEVRKYGSFEEQQRARLEKYHELLSKIQNKEKKAEAIEDILNVEMASKIKVHNEEQLRRFLTDDLRELNTCYKGKAYKATLILAGSILEAVLIDWLSEIHHKDYFNEDYMITDRRTGREKRADLIDYINEIKYIERPRWMEEATKAHEIRKKRNLVHAKLCINSDEINEDVCKQVIDYLRDVLKTRGVQ